jgi:hypothetical protein
MPRTTSQGWFEVAPPKIADGLPISGEERSCSGHHRNDRARTAPSRREYFELKADVWPDGARLAGRETSHVPVPRRRQAYVHASMSGRTKTE